MDPRALLIYTDGSAKPKNPGPGGIGVRFVFPEFLEKDEQIKDFKFPGYKTTTNNQMELMACVFGIKEAQKIDEIKNKKINSIVLCTDSQYVKDNFERAKYDWPKRKWRSLSGAPILNVLIWKDFIREVKRVAPVFVEIEKVKAHSKNEDNNAVDKMAQKATLNPIHKPFYNQIIRRKLSKEKTKRGSVEMLGQRIKIRIIDSKYLNEHKESQLRYEIISKRNKLYGKVDILFSKHTMRPGHEYLVILGKDMRYPKVEKLIKEIEKKNNS